MGDAAILVVDDDSPILRMLARTLGAEGYGVSTAGDGGAALAEVERSAPDLVVLDVAMPGLDGVALPPTACWVPVVRAVWVCAVYAAVPLLAAYVVFLRRDVASE